MAVDHFDERGFAAADSPAMPRISLGRISRLTSSTALIGPRTVVIGWTLVECTCVIALYVPERSDRPVEKGTGR